MSNRPDTLGSLRESGYRPTSVKAEMRSNLIHKLKNSEPLFPGIVGYDSTVMPQIQNAILSQHDMLFLGLRGQGKTRMLRMLVQLLDEYIPAVAGSEIHDCPINPLSKFARDTVSEHGSETPIEWIHRDDRYHEKLATPDVTIADLIGELDLIKHAEGRHLSNEDLMHFGLVPRSHRGIFCMNELPDLSPKIQVGLFNVLEERDVQIRGFPIRLALDLCLVFSANPEDYTNRGRIVTPLKDRIGSVVQTHYPLTRELGMQITDDNAWVERQSGPTVHVPRYMKEIVEETSRLARTSPHVNHASGVSVRMSISNYETMVSNAERRAIRQGLDATYVRPSDLSFVAASSRGKMELAMAEDSGDEDRLIERLVSEATKAVFDQHFKPNQFRGVLEYFEQGKTWQIGDSLSNEELLVQIASVPTLVDQLLGVATQVEPDFAVGELAGDLQCGLAEWILDGLHSHNRLNKKHKGTGSQYGL